MALDITIITTRVWYAPWEEGDDERALSDRPAETDTEPVIVHDLTDRSLSEFIAMRLNSAGVSETSSGASRVDHYTGVDRHMRYYGTYEHPHTGELEETLVEISGTDWDDDTAKMAFIEWVGN